MKLEKKGDNMKKASNVMSIVLLTVTGVLGIVTYLSYRVEFTFRQYLLYATVVLAVLSLSEIISRYRLLKQIKKGDYYESRLSLWNSISYRVKKSGEHAFNELPIGIVIISSKNEIVWSNGSAKKIFMSELKDIPLENISPDLLEKAQNKVTNFITEIYGKKYHVEFDAKYSIFYLTDITEIIRIKNKYDDRITALGYINVDNLEDILSDFDVQERAEFMYRIVSEIATWAEKYGAYVRAYSDNSYLLIMDKKQLLQMMDDNFNILDSIKNLVQGKLYKISLSIGIACVDENIEVLSNLAREQLELALNRGGDQVTVRVDEKVRFFGAKDDTAQAITKVTLRMKAEELQEIIKKSSSVMIVGHKGSDADAFGATLAVYHIAKSLGVPAYIIFDRGSIDPTVQRIYDSLHKDYVKLLENLITPQMALARMTEDTLLMVVDCQTKSQLSEPKLVEKASKIGVIDHHRRGDDAVDNLCFYLSSTAASSSVELIVQLYEFLDKEVVLDNLEATWLLLGIIVDTNNFVYRCTEKTFKVASILAKYGANMSGVKKFLREEKGEKVTRNKLIDNLEIIHDERVGIAVGEDNVLFERAELAKVSDEIISIVGIELGITVGRLKDNKIGISARSLGTVNVQLLMERLGGGGHFNNAAAQVQSDDINEVVKRLKQYIDEYIEKEESMKVILTKDVKGHGKRGEIIDFNLGFANHLIRSGQAIPVTNENLKLLDEQKKQAEFEEEKRVNEMKELKKLIEETPIKIGVKVGAEGKLFGSVSSKQIVDTFFKATGKTLNKQAIKLDKITALGTYNIPIDLYKDIKAKITLYVVEKE